MKDCRNEKRDGARSGREMREREREKERERERERERRVCSVYKHSLGRKQSCVGVTTRR